LSEVSGIAGIKEASGDVDQIQRIVHGRPKGFSVISGDDALTCTLMRMGCDGTISVASNCVPGKVTKMVDSCRNGKWDEALRMHDHLSPLFRALFCETSPIPIKYIMHRMGYGSGALRLPLTELSEGNRVLVENVMKEVIQ
jgi:4-hydroxy-tetrahydrodipicolinate synthase